VGRVRASRCTRQWGARRRWGAERQGKEHRIARCLHDDSHRIGPAFEIFKHARQADPSKRGERRRRMRAFHQGEPPGFEARALDLGHRLRLRRRRRKRRRRRRRRRRRKALFAIKNARGDCSRAPSPTASSSRSNILPPFSPSFRTPRPHCLIDAPPNSKHSL
jgi:hypothetical protein